MTKPVVDHASNQTEHIVLAAEVIGRSRHRAAVFKAIYTGQQQSKTVEELMRTTRLIRTRVLDATKKLSDHAIIERVKTKGENLRFRKVHFFQTYRNKVLKLAVNKTARSSIPTKRNPVPSKAKGHQVIVVKVLKKAVNAKQVTIDDIESFSKVKKIGTDQDDVEMAETKFKGGIAKVIGQRGDFKDWGGEQSDLFSTHLKYKGKRTTVAIAFKGPGTRGKLVPGKMGKNGDQIQRLGRCSAEMFLVQYWSQIDPSVLEQLEQIISMRAYLDGKPRYYGVIDGQDSARLITAYPKEFGV